MADDTNATNQQAEPSPSQAPAPKSNKLGNIAGKTREAHDAASDPVGYGAKKAGQALGKKINPVIDKAKEKVKDVTLEGAGKALAAPTGGLSEAAVRAYKAGRAAVNKLNEATKKLGVDFLEAWKKHKWRIIFFGCLGALLLAVFTLIIIVSSIASLFTLDTGDKNDQQLISQLEARTTSGKIQFLDPSDLNEIKEGNISRNVVNLLNFLADRHDLLVPRYPSGSTDNQIGTLDEPPELEPTTVSLAAADYIKCANTETHQPVGVTRIYLSSNYDFSSEIARLKSGLTEEDLKKIYCAVDYYPEIDAKKTLTFGDTLGLNGGYFSIYELEKLGGLAAQEKIAELLAETLNANNALKIDPDSTDSLLPEQITLDSTLGKMALTILQSAIKQAYHETPNTSVSLSDENAFGIQIKYVK
jgi:hypothetical protein